jgi:hypothetical protein
MPTSLYDCYQIEHAKYPRGDDALSQDAQRQAKSSSTGTNQTNPPKLLVTQSVDHWIDLANSLLQKFQTPLRRSHIADDEQAKAELKIEADVVRVCYTYITHPLGNTINIMYKADITVKTEEKSDRYRYDFSFNIRQDQPNKQNIMIIEFKRLGLIKYEQFEHAMREEEDIAQTFEDLEDCGEETTLDSTSNACILSKQAVAYAKNWDCKFVALCDYDNLVLLRFNQNSEYAYVTAVERRSIRKALLGFLIEACDHAGLRQRP